MKVKNILKIILINSLVLVLLMAGLEIFLESLYLVSPYLNITSLTKIARHYYLEYDRKIIQFDRKCAEHDIFLSYKMKNNNVCNFTNREFNIEVKTNSRGLRDTEASLNSPDLVILGDSQVFGWGVPIQDRFSEILEKKLNINILNTAVPSYGSAREILLFNSLNLPKPKALIWFYSDNDIQENKFFHDRSGHWKPKLRAVDYQAKSAFGGRAHEPINFLPYTRRFWPILFRSVTSKPKPAPIEKVTRRYDNLEARYFIYALLQNAAKLRNVPILVLEVDGWNKNDSNFLSAVEHFKKKKVDELQEKGIELTLLDISTKLKAEHYYFYDDHMNSKGQAEIAKLLEPWVASKVNGK